MNDILWVVGIVVDRGHVESVIIRHDDPHPNDSHETLFGPFGTRWRASSIDDVTWYKEVSDEEQLRVQDHLENIFGL